MVIGDKKFGVVSYALVGGSRGILPQNIFCNFLTPRSQMWAFSETDFWIYSVLCKYHNWVTHGVGSLLNLVGPNL
jgi:hypothetical protein